MQILKKINCYENFNNLTYPLLVIDDLNNLIWANKKAKTIIDENILKEQLNNLIGNLNKKVVLFHNIYYEINLSFIVIEDKTYKSLSLFNISKRKKLEEQVINGKKMFEMLSEQLPEAILVCDDKIIYTNPALEKMLGYPNSYLLNKKFEELLDDENRVILMENLENLASDKKKKVEFLLSIEKKKGSSIWINVVSKLVFEDEKFVYIHLIKDITSSKEEKEKLEKLANTDLLTNIYNRRKFQELFDREYKRSKRYKSELSIIFFDVDHFKKINDTYGHDIGDIVLKDISLIVSKHIRETDIFARWGGEEFIILLPETTSEEAHDLAENLRALIMNRIFLEVGNVTISLGITKLKKESQKNFLKRADSALYRAKNKGRNTSIVL